MYDLALNIGFRYTFNETFVVGDCYPVGRRNWREIYLKGGAKVNIVYQWNLHAPENSNISLWSVLIT